MELLGKKIFYFFIFLIGCAQEPVKIPVDIEFVKIEPGSFVYGKFQPTYPKSDTVAARMAKTDAMPGFTVTIPESFSIGKYEVTQAQWKKVMNTNPSYFKGDSLPVQNISWNGAQEFISKLNAMDPSHTYRLPTEFEWEYAARAGAADDISWDEIRGQAHISADKPDTVGSKKPNAWGLYDMLGNVWEWTSDIYNEKIFADQTPAIAGSEHVLKGSSFVGDVKNATYMTHAAGPGNGWDVGFRVIRARKRNRAEKESTITLRPLSDSINGWHISRTTHQGTTPEVTINNGEIVMKQHPFGQGGVLLTNKKYRDFELSIEVKLDSFCNSGIFLRSSESGQAYQVELAEPGGTGSLFGEMMRISTPAKAEKKSAVWKPGGWNHFRIRMTGEVPRIALWINGELMWDVAQPQNDFTAGATEGMIGLQTHWSATYSEASKAFDMSESWRPGAEIRFRNFLIKEL
ncbi:MAG: SUMF1/EgtB/PvdO family nonheme iron enzyme [Chitinophagaceae bacterium]|nr:SUMF1/EgtB/PvdO family nonheme iron enzyme [Chitinophagaceae bacterium]